ncbi:MAG: PKD domain-containing protein [Trueperaceae bacterium]|nr:PKD domain-containing protein [Trueperaceae bacterium]
MHHARRWLPIVTSVLPLILLAACGTGGSGPDEQEVVVPDTTKIVDDDTADALTAVEADGTLRFARETDVLASLQEEDVLVAGIVEGAAPDGFLRTVTDIDAQGSGEVVLQTEQATLTQAIDHADIEFRRQLEADDVANTQSHVGGAQFVAQQGDKPFGLDMSEVLVSVEDAQVRVDGEVDAAAELIFELSIDKSQPLKPKTWVRRFEAAAALEEEIDLTLSAEGTIDRSAEKELKTLNIASIEFLIGPVPVVIAADLTFFLQFDGTLTAEVTTRVAQSASLQVGGRYRRSDGWSGINETHSSFTHDVPTFEASAEARVAAGSRVAVGLYGEQGAAGTITGRAFLDAEAQTRGFPLWCVYGGLNASYGYQVSVPVIDVQLASYDEVFAELREEIACADNNAPDIAIVDPSDGETFPEATDIAFEADASDAEGDPSVSWRVEGRDPSGSGATFTVNDLCPGDHTVTATATDAQGATASAQVTVTITNAAPEVTIVEAPDRVGEGNDAAFRGTATDPTCEDPEGTQVNLDRLVWDLEDGLGGSGAGILASFTAQGSKTVTLSYQDQHGATAQDTTTVEVGPFDPNADPVVTIREPNEGRRYDLLPTTDPCHRIEVEAQASASVDDSDLIWSYDLGAGTVDFGTGRQATLELSCNDVAIGSGFHALDLRVRAEGETADSASAAVETAVQGLGQ